ncbi:hypothetical protein ACIQNU_31870 [Streptomyces sp. NPDC091292]|uniref:hypothetical protein n=1 Tax=Streptomyces sp. NPDC091292 TaxID=3365991 RepID=UPI0037FD5F1A
MTPTARRIPLSLTLSAWAAPVLVLVQFSLVAAVPVAIALVTGLGRARDRAVRLAAGLLAVTFAAPLTIWLVRPDGAPSLSKDMHPAFLALFVAASAVLLTTLHGARRPRLRGRRRLRLR